MKDVPTKMYTNLLAREQFRTIKRLWNKQQLRLITESTSVHQFGHSSATQYGSGSLTSTTLQENDTSLVKRFFSEDGHGGKAFEVAKGNVAKRSPAIYADEVYPEAEGFNIKRLLYGEDDIMKMLNQCTNSEELMKMLDQAGTKMHKEHLVQTIILLWTFSNQADNSHRTPTVIQLLHKVIASLSQHVSSLNINEMSTCYLYLRKMDIDNANTLVQELLMRSLSEIENTEEIIGLPALSRLVEGINVSRDFFTPMLCSHFLRHLDHHVSACVSDNEARLISVCMQNLQPLIDDDMMNRYKVAVKHLLQSKAISASTPKTVLNILHMLNMGVWCQKHVPLIRDLLMSLESAINQIDATELKNLCRIYQFHMEPAALHESLSEAVEGLLSTNMSPETLACFVPFSQPHKRQTLINAYKALISSSNSWKEPNATSHLFSTLRGLKISDPKLCDAFWNGVLNKLETVPEAVMNLRFLRHCHRYMNFNNNLGGTYRNMALEKRLSQLCMTAIEHDISGRLPNKFARLASFVLAYGHTPFCWKKYPNILLSKIINMAEQFSPFDCFVLSRGLQISLEMRFRNRVPKLVGMQQSTIDGVLVTCVERFLNDDQLTATNLNMLVKILITRKNLKNTIVYHKLLQKYKEIQCDDLNSRTIKDMAYNFLSSNYLVPEVLDAMCKYLENNYHYVMGETVEKILTCTYNLGYTPESCDYLHYAGKILLRDFNYMSGLALVQSCLALCYYKTISDELINKVFCVKFIQRVEDEIQECYSKATYPERVLNIVMELNRSVCLDVPEANVPWFQQNFIEAQIIKKPNDEPIFGNEVKSLLSTMLKDDSYLRFNHTTPYGYQIDFVINFDKDKKPIKPPVETTMLDRITKVAILLLKLDSFCSNDLNALRGPDLLKIRHLEMMGYKVLHINEHDWNSKYMNVPGAKKNYLKCLLQISS